MTAAELEKRYAVFAEEAKHLVGPLGRDEVLAEARRQRVLLDGRNMSSRSNGSRSWNGGK